MKKQVDLEVFRHRYRRTNRKGKGKLLTELCDLYGYNRKYLLQFFNHLTGKKYTRRGPRLKYAPTKELLEPLKRIWLASDQMCSKRLKEAIPVWLQHYEESYDLMSEEMKGKLLTMSTGTLDQLLKTYRLR